MAVKKESQLRKGVGLKKNNEISEKSFCGNVGNKKINLNIKPIKIKLNKYNLKFPIDGMF